MTSKRDLSETDIITQFILPAIVRAGWDLGTQIRQNVYFTNGRIANVDELEKQVNERKRYAEDLLQAVLREAFEGCVVN